MAGTSGSSLHGDLLTGLLFVHRHRHFEYAILECCPDLVLIGAARKWNGSIERAVVDLAPKEAFALLAVLSLPLAMNHKRAILDVNVDIVGVETGKVGPHDDAIGPLQNFDIGIH